MGYLTPILIRNDYLHDLIENSEATLQKIKEGATSSKQQDLSIAFYRTNRSRKWWQFWKPKKVLSGINVNPMNSLGSQHSDGTRLVLIHGNGWVDLSREIYFTSVTSKQIKNMIRIAEEHIHELKKAVERRDIDGDN